MATRIIFATLAALAASTTALSARASNSGSLTVTGQGSVEVPTSQAQVSLSVDKTTPCKKANTNQCNGQKAQSEASAVLTNVIDYLKSVDGVSKLVTNNIIVQPQYDYSDNKSPVLTSYKATSSLSFNVDNEEAGEVLQNVLEKGVTNIDSVNFVASDKDIDKAQDQALKQAVKDAEKQADAVLDAIGSKATGITNIQIGSSSPPSPIPMAMAAGADNVAEFAKVPPPIEGGTQTVSGSVTLNMTYS